jgi:5-methylcytosine-specific restriction protein B
MTKYFTINRLKRAIEHLQNYDSNWVIVPLVFAVNGIDTSAEININTKGHAGSDKFIDQYFNGSLIGLPPFPRTGINTLRPRFSDIYGNMKSEGHSADYVLHQNTKLWANVYSSRGYREMRQREIVKGTHSKFMFASGFWKEWKKKLPNSFNFEELLVWLYAFRGLNDGINDWKSLFKDFQEKHLGDGQTFPVGYNDRFNVDNGVRWPKDFLTAKSSDEEYQRELIPSRFKTAASPKVMPTLLPEPDSEEEQPPLPEPNEADPIFISLFSRVEELLQDYSGVILTGPPGTSKTWYVSQIAAKLVNRDPKRARFVQFHPSYQYEDFVEGFVPQEGGGYRLTEKHFLDMCKAARDVGDDLCVIIIDELSRSDPARVFGEALTYMEKTKRDQFFHLASGRRISIPPNLVFLATMNPMDRGVDEVDAALERRFGKIAMDPSVVILEQILGNNGVDTTLTGRVLEFFKRLLKNRNAQSRIGHAYFQAVKDEAGLRRLWDNQLRFHFEKAFRLNEEGYREVERDWQRILPPTKAENTESTEAVAATTAIADAEPAESS